MAPKIQRSTSNVFTDLGFSPEEAEHLRVRADLMIELTKLIRARGLTQARAAKLFGVSQPRVGDLMRGKIDRFSIDTLVEMLGYAGAHVRFKVQRRRQSVTAAVDELAGSFDGPANLSTDSRHMAGYGK